MTEQENESIKDMIEKMYRDGGFEKVKVENHGPEGIERYFVYHNGDEDNFSMLQSVRSEWPYAAIEIIIHLSALFSLQGLKKEAV